MTKKKKDPVDLLFISTSLKFLFRISFRKFSKRITVAATLFVLKQQQLPILIKEYATNKCSLDKWNLTLKIQREGGNWKKGKVTYLIIINRNEKVGHQLLYNGLHIWDLIHTIKTQFQFLFQTNSL